MEYVLITGATSGIGYAFAECFAGDGYGLLLVSSNKERLLKTKEKLLKKFDVSIEIFEQDLSRPEAAEELYRKIREQKKHASFLINNAGFGLLGAADEIDMEKEERMLTLNMITPVKLTKLFLQDLKEQEERTEDFNVQSKRRRGKNIRGRILNVASTGAFQPGPYNSTYYASKAFLYSYSRAVRYELKKKGVSVSTLCPGTTGTGFFERAGTKTPGFAMPPEKAAAYAYRRMKKGKDVIIPGLLNRFLRVIPVNVKLAGVAVMKEKQAKNKR